MDADLRESVAYELNSNMRCFEINEKVQVKAETKKLNSNMRCFEIFKTLSFLDCIYC